MNKEETMYFDMFVQVQRHLDQSPDKWSAIPAITRYKNTLDENLTAIKAKDLEASGNSKGLTVTKSELKNQLALKIAILCGAMYAYGSEKRDARLTSQVEYSPSSLYKMADMEFAQQVATLIALASDNVSELADQGVSDDQITESSSSLDDFYEMIGKPRTQYIQSNTASMEAAELISATLDLLRDQLDKAMLRYRLMDTAFYEGYERARVLVD